MVVACEYVLAVCTHFARCVHRRGALKHITARQQASGDDADDYSVECAICYAYHLDDAVPECACDSCNKPFHQMCLCEWLRGLPTTHQSFNRLFGECPYCSKSITVEALRT